MFDFLLKDNDDPQKTEEVINNLEKKYSIVFPNILKQLYKQTITGKMSLCVFSINESIYETAAIVPIINEGFCFEKIADSDRSYNSLPDSFFPLAYDRGGNFYYWDCNNCKVYFSLTDDIENPVLISNSVDDFVILLNNSIRK